MKLYLTPEDGYFHQCLDPLFRCVYRHQDGYYKCPVCEFKFSSILLLGSDSTRKVLRYDKRMLLSDGYEQLGRVPSVHKDEIGKNKNYITIIDV